MIRRWVPLIALYVALIFLGWFISDQVSAALVLTAGGGGFSGMMWMVVLVCAIYVLASALPFVPGAEIGLGLIAVFGAPVALLVYLCMICALSLSFLIGRLVPARWLAGLFAYLRLDRASVLVRDLADQSPEACEARLRRATDNRFLRALLGYRYIALALAINLPGNTVLGGGGGLALVAGMSRLFSPFWFFVTLLLAVAPIPLTVFVMGYQP
ncbi:hypothetical protein ROLI_002870 [Roseobacter fucihabitans]|uniref:TVP38/TMEM64 family membrane protein n=1 Tax=Roseobacter fucihabitans TaxID=1537242 RepID=A0ABZ2BMA1_9RHOB|nr:hypothetical protein [Roseobacter litoralis]MBC6963537.1 hypothetical protein [Roseobacter litoralis]